MFIDYFQYKRCLQWYTYCMIWTPSVHLYSYLQLMRYFHIFSHYLYFRQKGYDSQCYTFYPRPQAQKLWHQASNLVILIPRSMSFSVYIDCLSFFGNICISDLYEVTEVFIKFVLHTELRVSTNGANDRIHIWGTKPSWLRSWA